MKRAIMLLAAIVAVGCGGLDDQTEVAGDAGAGTGQLYGIGEGPVEMVQYAVTSVTYNNPYGDSSTQVILGRESASNQIWVLFRRKSDSNCTGWIVDNTSPLNTHVIVYLGAGADTATMNPPTFQGVTMFCANWGQSYTFYQFQQLEFTEHAYHSTTGGGGNDVMNFSGYGTANGGTGNDRLIVQENTENYPWTMGLFGEGGDDVLKVLSAGKSNRMYGGDGNDCLHNSSGTQQTAYDCGPGSSDKKVNSSSGINCETVVTQCPN